jgi:hypothetical protein
MDRKLYCVKHGNNSVLDWMLEACFTSKAKALKKARSLAKSSRTVFVYSESVKNPGANNRNMVWSKRGFSGRDRETLPEAVRRLVHKAGKAHRDDEVIDAMSGGLPAGADRELRALVARVLRDLRREGR